MRRRFRRSAGDPTSADPARTEVSGGGFDDHDSAERSPGASFDALLARQLDRVDETVDPVEAVSTDRQGAERVDPEPAAVVEPAPAEPPRSVERSDRPIGRAETSGPGVGDFWEHYDRAVAEAHLTTVPPAAVVAVVGPLAAAEPVIRRCRDRHWMGDCDVFVLTQQPIDGIAGPDQRPWTAVAQPSDLVAVLEDGGSDFPLLVLDVPRDLPAFVRPLVARLRESGVGLIHYVFDGDPGDEDLATWHGELGRPSVLDLAGPVASDRVLELLDRGEPVVSVAGRDLDTDLLLALRVEHLVDELG